ncbi:MAG: hypothetical protein IJN50_03645 [Clostridia bacterium]|nr:hypothetical protein [Clostridia bacterium]
MEKKKMKLWKKILLVVLALIVVFAIITLRKYIIITNLISASKNYVGKTNFIVDTYGLTNDSVTLTKIYNKDENFLSTHKTYSNNITEIRSLTVYNKDNEKIGIIESGEDKIALLNGNIAIGATGINTMSEFDDIKFKIPLVFTSKITTEECNNKECYLIELSKDYKIWVEKETGIIVREMDIGYITNRTYIFDVVKDEDIIKPDISDCVIQE